MKGKKICPECQELNAARSYQCKFCRHIFDFSSQDNNFDWKSLKNGDLIKTKFGSGPYWMTSDEEPKKIPMGYYGKFKVIRVMQDGILARGYKENNMTMFLYMGEDMIAPTGTFMQKHVIKKIKKRDLYK